MLQRPDEIIRFEGVSKIFPGVKALDNVNFSVKRGEIHALLGENGAGKSTLLNILHGVYSEYDGTVKIKDKKVSFKNPNDAIQFGISKVHQEVSLIPNLTVGQNIVLGYEPTKSMFVNFKEIHKKANELLKKLNCRFKSEDLASQLSTGEMQMVAIAKALYHKAEIISFDEPTASLTKNEVAALFKILNELRKDGITILYVSHHLDEVFEVCDRATILRDGGFIKTVEMSKVSQNELIRNMVGRDVSAFAVRSKKHKFTEDIVLEVSNLSRSGVFENISFSVRKGEILGFAGLVGAKRTDVVRALFGADKKTSGTVKVKGKIAEIKTPEQGLQAGIGLIPENRKTQGFTKYFSNADNIGLASLGKFSKLGFINHKNKRKNCQHYINEINLNPKDPSYMTANLSGGNQQKVVISKWLSADVDVLILDEPTKGVDVGAKAEIYRILEDLVDKGKSIIIVSSELPEVIGMCDRVIVMKEGKQVVELNKEELNEENILQYAMGVNADVYIERV
ncbi:sugar ABC transporter ATP-binding protein [Domibacillus sp. 8LH]|uniref:sugar ABC transporter ATP-binding protein n=1 Tax=Domibacillus sp. 8LH TaxID=3073900 RepID=UPI003171F434